MKETHPSYGLLSFSRVHGSPNGKPLFGSSIKHRDTIYMELKYAEYKEHLKQTYQKSIALANQIRELLKSKKTINKKEKEEILSKLLMIQNDLVSNQEFQLSQFQEQMDKTVQEAEGEIESFYKNRLNVREIESGDIPLYIKEGNTEI